MKKAAAVILAALLFGAVAGGTMYGINRLSRATGQAQTTEAESESSGEQNTDETKSSTNIAKSSDNKDSASSTDWMFRISLKRPCRAL